MAKNGYPMKQQNKIPAHLRRISAGYTRFWLLTSASVTRLERAYPILAKGDFPNNSPHSHTRTSTTQPRHCCGHANASILIVRQNIFVSSIAGKYLPRRTDHEQQLPYTSAVFAVDDNLKRPHDKRAQKLMIQEGFISLRGHSFCSDYEDTVPF